MQQHFDTDGNNDDDWGTPSSSPPHPPKKNTSPDLTLVSLSGEIHYLPRLDQKGARGGKTPWGEDHGQIKLDHFPNR